MLDVTRRKLQGWVRIGLLTPDGDGNFDFAQVARARAIHRLTESGATPARIRRSLEMMGRWLPADQRSPTALEPGQRRGPLLVRLDDGRRAEASGQLHFAFQSQTPARLTALRSDPSAAEASFEAALLAEKEGNLEEARSGYQHALEVGGPSAEIAFNLGNVLYAMERRREAVDRYEQAVQLDPAFAEAWNNLGNALSDLSRYEPAIDAFRRALSLEPSYVDVHYNLALALEADGKPDDAKPHWEAYLAADPESDWGKEARERLEGEADS